MSEEVERYEANDALEIIRNPKAVLAEAKDAAQQLVSVVRQAKLARKFGGEREHLFFEAWQTVAKFYGCTPKVDHSTYVEFGTAHGFEARAVVVDRNGMEISAAEAMCLSDEPNWKNKPLFQLKSMAQTRAASKALRNVFAWVAVLAGFAPTPAEEMTGNEYKKDPIPDPQRKPPAENTNPASEAQLKKLAVMMHKCQIPEDQWHTKASLVLGLPEPIESMKVLTVPQASALIEALTKEAANEN